MKHICGMHLEKLKNGDWKIKNNKKYTWSISKKLEKENISKGDIVLALCKNTKAPVMVLDVFENDDEKIKRKKIIKILDKNKI
ncbi:DUF5839 family protein [Clostridium perfringens]|uniref:DUF5839 family protein n=1 Tax=Clostridium perfringens TaxID=1502 RepID=UPI0024BC8622|nr:DUF5839 family protein [Clostridium perfringens]